MPEGTPPKPKYICTKGVKFGSNYKETKLVSNEIDEAPIIG